MGVLDEMQGTCYLYVSAYARSTVDLRTRQLEYVGADRSLMSSGVSRIVDCHSSDS
jgi:hypothetical protein